MPLVAALRVRWAQAASAGSRVTLWPVRSSWRTRRLRSASLGWRCRNQSAPRSEDGGPVDSRCQAITRIECATATIALLCPAVPSAWRPGWQERCPCRGRRRWRPRRARPAAIGSPCGSCPRGACRPTGCWPGRSPPSSPSARRRDLAHVGADLGEDDLSGSLADPGIVINRASSGEHGATTRATWGLSRSTASSR